MGKKKSKYGQMDLGLFYTIALLLAVGVVMVYSASSYYAMFNYEGDSMFFLKRVLMFTALGVVAMFIISNIDYHEIKKYTGWLLIGTIPLMLAVFLFPETKGAQRWIKLGALSFQPSELAKYVVVLFLALNLSKKGDKVKDFWHGVVPCLIVGGFYAGLILIQKNLSITAVTMMVTFIMLFVAGGKLSHLFGIVAPALFAGATAFTVLEPYRMRRLMNFTDPWKDPAGDGYQLIQSFYALGAGGLTGLGLGQSRQKTLYMPEPHNDFIFAIIGEELGLIGCIAIIALFIFLIYRGIKIAMKAKDDYGTLLAIGITSVVAIQAIINIAVVTGSMPVTGVPLPFISYGGSSLVINLVAMGILLNISKQGNKENKSK